MPQKDQVVRQQPGNPSRSVTPASRGASPHPNRGLSRSPGRNPACCCCYDSRSAPRQNEIKITTQLNTKSMRIHDRPLISRSVGVQEQTDNGKARIKSDDQGQTHKETKLKASVKPHQKSGAAL